MTAIMPGALAQEVTSSGALSYTYPLYLPQGRNGIAPNLSLVYNSNAGNGMLGVGWSLGGLSIITRDSSYDITFNDTTDHFLLDGQKLILGGDTYYHTEKESYVRILFMMEYPKQHQHMTILNFMVLVNYIPEILMETVLPIF